MNHWRPLSVAYIVILSSTSTLNPHQWRPAKLSCNNLILHYEKLCNFNTDCWIHPTTLTWHIHKANVIKDTTVLTSIVWDLSRCTCANPSYSPTYWNPIFKEKTFRGFQTNLLATIFTRTFFWLPPQELLAYTADTHQEHKPRWRTFHAKMTIII